jgi:predicted Holliday junction resolvase-like endonuclease
MTYSIIVTLVAIMAVGAAVTAFRNGRARVAAVSRELNEVLAANRDIRKEMDRRAELAIQREVISNEATEKKREVRSQADPVDRAHAALDLMSELSRGGDKN